MEKVINIIVRVLCKVYKGNCKVCRLSHICKDIRDRYKLNGTAAEGDRRMGMTECTLKQYTAIKKEIEDLRRKIKNLERNDNNLVTDKVTGSSKDFPYTKRGFTITGLDISGVDKKKKNIAALNEIRESHLLALLEMETEIEEFLQKINDSRVRQIFRSIYLDGESQERVGDRLGFHRSTVSRTIKKYLEKK